MCFVLARSSAHHGRGDKKVEQARGSCPGFLQHGWQCEQGGSWSLWGSWEGATGQGKLHISTQSQMGWGSNKALHGWHFLVVEKWKQSLRKGFVAVERWKKAVTEAEKKERRMKWCSQKEKGMMTDSKEGARIKRWTEGVGSKRKKKQTSRNLGLVQTTIWSHWPGCKGSTAGKQPQGQLARDISACLWHQPGLWRSQTPLKAIHLLSSPNEALIF